MDRMRTLHALLSQATVTTTAALPEVDISKYFVSPAKREIMATCVIFPTGADTDEVTDVKMQESPTTVDSDFTDITGATFSQVAQEDTPAVQQIFFMTKGDTKYLRAHHTGAGTTISFRIAVEIFLIKRSA